MNLITRFSPVPDTNQVMLRRTETSPGKFTMHSPAPFSDNEVTTRATAAKAALQVQLDALLVTVRAACLAAYRGELEAGSGAVAGAVIQPLVQRITDLEGQIEFYNQVLGIGTLEQRVAALET